MNEARPAGTCNACILELEQSHALFKTHDAACHRHLRQAFVQLNHEERDSRPAMRLQMDLSWDAAARMASIAGKS